MPNRWTTSISPEIQGSAALDALLAALPSLQTHHGRDTPAHHLLEQVARREIEALFGGPQTRPAAFGPFGAIALPYYRMGNIDSLDLFGIDELIIFAFYWANRDRYRTALDLGANIGLHSIILDRCGCRVTAFEPDPETAGELRRNLVRNGCSNVEVREAAVAAEAGTRKFVRTHGNRTSSHLMGAKSTAHGDLEVFPVAVKAYAGAAHSADLVKMDVEGQEGDIITSTTRAEWESTDMMMEVGTAENAAAIYEHLSALGVGMFAQKIGWRRVASVADVPTSYREGSLFVTCRAEMPWE